MLKGVKTNLEIIAPINLMTKFIKLTNFLFNANDIHKIVIKPNKYCIHIANKQINGFVWTIAGCGSGYISSSTSEIEVCKTIHPKDYNLISDWIKRH
jgi:hypothetical protein